jgi:hypothetical protein
VVKTSAAWFLALFVALSRFMSFGRAHSGFASLEDEYHKDPGMSITFLGEPLKLLRPST